MVVTFDTGTLNGLCSKDQLELLDCVDRLRLQGIDHLFSLPQIIVCGDQSSGKSSVLEAISGVPFPIKGNLCTRFPTELVLRRAAEKAVRVSIVPHDSLDDSEQPGLSGFQEELDGFEGFPDLIEKAQAAMGISTQGMGFSKDLLRVEISGPDRPHLTIVDLPGLIHTETKQQSASDVELVKSVVKDYMKQPRSVILAVVSAKNDFANQIVLKFARSIDPKGTRTMGVITKPDTLAPGSESEKSFLSLARNEEVKFNLGWHVLKNMDSEKGPVHLHQRNTEEAQFFRDNIWHQLPLPMLGIQELRTRLSDVLLRQIAAELPSLISEIENGLVTCRKQLKDLGVPRSTLDEQRKYLLQISQDFQALVKAAIGGIYTDSFFESAESTKGQLQRIRAVVQNLNQEFADDLSKHGHRRAISQSQSGDKGNNDATKSGDRDFPIQVSYDEFIDHIEILIGKTRGRELPGNFNSMVIADLFLEQSGPWEKIVGSHIQRVWEESQTFLGFVVHYVADSTVQENIVRRVCTPAMDALLASVKAKTAQLLAPHKHIHPITYNKDYVNALDDNIGYAGRKTRYTRIVRDFFGFSSIEGQQVHISSRYVNLEALVESLAKHNGSDVQRSAASVALECMNTYYDIAIKRFIDDVSIQVIEETLLSALPGILSPVSVFSMKQELVTLIMGESQKSLVQREELTKKIDVLEKGSKTCNRFVHFRHGDELSIDIEESFQTPERLRRELLGIETNVQETDEGSEGGLAKRKKRRGKARGKAIV